MVPSAKWLRTAELYKRFAKDFPQADFSDEAATAMYNWESSGVPIPNPEWNGFSIGKRYMGVTVAMWREDCPLGLLSRLELLDDGYPEWFLNKVLGEL